MNDEKTIVFSELKSLLSQNIWRVSGNENWDRVSRDERTFAFMWAWAAFTLEAMTMSDPPTKVRDLVQSKGNDLMVRLIKDLHDSLGSFHQRMLQWEADELITKIKIHLRALKGPSPDNSFMRAAWYSFNLFVHWNANDRNFDELEYAKAFIDLFPEVDDIFERRLSEPTESLHSDCPVDDFDEHSDSEESLCSVDE